MTTKSRSVLLTDYSKEELITSLKDAKSRIEEAILSHEEAFAKWKEEAPTRFAEYVAGVEIDKIGYVHIDSFKPPLLKDICKDWRVQSLNKAIARIGLINGDVVRLRADDDI